MQKHLKLPPKPHPIFYHLAEFRLDKKIGDGSLSVVYKAIHRDTKSTYAIKCINLAKLDQYNQENISNEINAHRVMSHKNIVRLYDYFREDNFVYLVMEYCEGGNLFNHLALNSPLSVDKIQKIFKQTVDAIDYIHKKGFINRDIKAENILLDKYMNVKICDFGCAVHKSDDDYRKIKIGTIPYMSPESLMGEYQEFSSDLWSLGILLYELFNNQVPYSGMTCNGQLSEIKKKSLYYVRKDMPYEAKDLIEKLLVYDSVERLHIAHIYNHVFICHYDKAQRLRSPDKNRQNYLLDVSVHRYDNLIHGEYEKDPKSVSASLSKSRDNESYFAKLAKQLDQKVEKPSDGLKEASSVHPTKNSTLVDDTVMEKPRKLTIAPENSARLLIRGAKAVNDLNIFSFKNNSYLDRQGGSLINGATIAENTIEDITDTPNLAHESDNTKNVTYNPFMNTSKEPDSTKKPTHKANDKEKSRPVSTSLNIQEYRKHLNKNDVSYPLPNLKRNKTPLIRKAETIEDGFNFDPKRYRFSPKVPVNPQRFKVVQYIDKLAAKYKSLL